ncbi:hypothetical protein LguiB_005488 [Lonicera macranthoides]
MGCCLSSHRQQHKPANPDSPKSQNNDRENYDLRIFTYEELKKATKQFRPDKVLEESYFGMVYKGKLGIKDNRGYYEMLVSIQKFNPKELQDDEEWMAEVNYLGNLRHPNLVRLVGYCCDRAHRFLVYEFMASGSLEKHLFNEDGETLNWTRRMKIALDVAKGLAFLHAAAERPIIFRYFKTSNILLDKHLNAKLFDVGLQKNEYMCVSMRVLGYTAPEYGLTGRLTAKNNVYGFGVMLLEMLTGRRAIDNTKFRTKSYNLVQFALSCLDDYNKLRSILDPRIDGQFRHKDINFVALLALECLNPDDKARPSMNDVVNALEASQY